jgi:hypothetical protein
MSPWFLIVPLIGLVFALVRIWTIVRDVRAEAKAKTPAPAGQHAEATEATELNPQQQVALLTERVTELNGHMMAMRETLATLARHRLVAGAQDNGAEPRAETQGEAIAH